MKKFTFLFLLVLIGVWSASGQAEVKLKYRFSQDATYARDMDMNKGDADNPVATRGNLAGNTLGNGSGDSYYFFSSLLGVNALWAPLSNTEVLADLVAQFDWHGSNGTVFPQQTAIPGQAVGTYPNTGSTTAIGFGFKELNLKLTDFFDFPVDLKVGRQDIKLGRGFIVDSWIVGAGGAPYENGRGPSGSGAAAGAGRNGQHTGANTGNLPINATSPGSLYAPEKSAFDAFDAVTARVHFDKLNIDLGYALIASAFSEADYGTALGGTRSDREIATADNEHLSFFNVGYTWDKVFSGLLTEAYFVYNLDDEPTVDRQVTTAGIESAKVYTLGGRGDWNWGKGFLGFKNVNTYVEGAYQLGKLGGDNTDSALGRKRRGYAANLGSDFSLDSTSKWLPSLFKLEAIVLSGEGPGGLEDDDATATGGLNDVGSGNPWGGWDWQFMGPAFWYAKIMPFLDLFYLTDVLAPPGDSTTAPIMGKHDAGLTNRAVLRAKADFEWTKKLFLSLNAAYATAMQLPQAGLKPSQKKFGQELDWDLVYKLSKVTDLTFDGGVLFPGSYYKRIPNTGRRTPATYLLRLGFKVDLG
ncbi:MAG: hypothetical protein HYY61_03925 [Deltaproteobacteria bacterium]|nr:hypothetical protein [Deltaproteobacteria bacterium]